MIKTDSSKYIFAGGIKQEEEWDIFLYKLNADLSSAGYVIDTITYDYLCDDLPIVSDTIDLSSCGIITGVKDIPTPEEYYSNRKNIGLLVSPNPASDNLKLTVENRGRLNSLNLKCYNTSGKVMYQKELPPSTDGLGMDVSDWPVGIYIAVVTSRDGKTGSVKFVVKK